MTAALDNKKKKLYEIVGRESRAAVACSGGVDSVLLLRVVHEVLGPVNTIAVFADTPLLPPGEADAVREIVGSVGSSLLVVDLDPLSWPEFRANPLERCYLCKKKIYQSFQKKLVKLDFNVLMDGTNLDDLDDFRPGLKALHELKIKTPLAEAGLTKKEVRRLSRELNLPNWNRHSSSCLATRIESGRQINREKLKLVNRCENILHDLGFEGCRARLFDNAVIVELLEQDIERFVREQARELFMIKCNDYQIKRVYLSMKGRKGIIV